MKVTFKLKTESKNEHGVKVFWYILFVIIKPNNLSKIIFLCPIKLPLTGDVVEVYNMFRYYKSRTFKIVIRPNI